MDEKQYLRSEFQKMHKTRSSKTYVALSKYKIQQYKQLSTTALAISLRTLRCPSDARNPIQVVAEPLLTSYDTSRCSIYPISGSVFGIQPMSYRVTGTKHPMQALWTSPGSGKRREMRCVLDMWRRRRLFTRPHSSNRWLKGQESLQKNPS